MYKNIVQLHRQKIIFKYKQQRFAYKKARHKESIKCNKESTQKNLVEILMML